MARITPNINSQLKSRKRPLYLHVMSDRQVEFVKTLLTWLKKKRNNLPLAFKDIRDNEINMLHRILRTNQYQTKDRKKLNELREQYISEKI